MYDLIIIGGGVAGMTAAIYAARSGLSTLIIEKAGFGGQAALTAKIENYPSYKEIDGFQLAADIKAQVDALRNIKHVSVRERSGVDICESLGIEAKHVLDPVMVCGMQHYQRLLEKASMEFPEHYGLCFIRHVGEHIDPIRISNSVSLDFINIAGPDINLSEAKTPYPMAHAGTVENWVKSIYCADYVLTDSFHAAALCIVFGKQFTVVYGEMGESTGLDRFRSLLGLFDLEGRMYRTTWDAVISEDFGERIDYKAVHARLEELRKDSLDWLKDALEIEKEYRGAQRSKALSSHDMHSDLKGSSFAYTAS